MPGNPQGLTVTLSPNVPAQIPVDPTLGSTLLNQDTNVIELALDQNFGQVVGTVQPGMSLPWPGGGTLWAKATTLSMLLVTVGQQNYYNPNVSVQNEIIVGPTPQSIIPISRQNGYTVINPVVGESIRVYSLAVDCFVVAGSFAPGVVFCTIAWVFGSSATIAIAGLAIPAVAAGGSPPVVSYSLTVPPVGVVSPLDVGIVITNTTTATVCFGGSIAYTQGVNP